MKVIEPRQHKYPFPMRVRCKCNALLEVAQEDIHNFGSGECVICPECGEIIKVEIQW
jgi:hypothetical protein